MFARPDQTVAKDDYLDFCNAMYILGNYKTMTLSQKAYESLNGAHLLQETVDIKENNKVIETIYIVQTGSTTKKKADKAAAYVNKHSEHMDRYLREQNWQANNQLISGLRK